jgi:predicted amidophosphoribosyltransferase
VGVVTFTSGYASPSRIAARLLDAAFPAVCAGCGVEGAPLCPDCLPALSVRRGTPPGVPLGLPSTVPLPLLQLEWCAPFAGVVRSALHALKYAGERRLAAPLGSAIASRWAEAGVGGDLLVPVPIHAERRRRRGYDQAVLLADAAAASLRARS